MVKGFFSLFLAGWIEVEQMNSASGYLEYWSVVTITYFLLGNGPHKSTSTVFQGLCESWVIFSGSVCCMFEAVWQLKHAQTMFSIWIFIAIHRDPNITTLFQF